MNLKEQVISIEFARKMKDLSIDLESYYIWAIDSNEEAHILLRETKELFKTTKDIYPAYTVAELGLLMPAKACLFKTEVEENISKWIYRDEYYEKEADVRAVFLIEYFQYIRDNMLQYVNQNQNKE